MGKAAETLVGRAAELSALDRALDEGSASLIVLGEPGIGKTRLLAELIERAEQRGWVALSGSASELEVDLPFWVFVDALDEYVAALDRLRLDADVLAELAQVLPSLAAPARAGDAPLQ